MMTDTKGKKKSNIKLPKLKVPKINLKKVKAPKMSKINLRKVNWITISGILCYLHALVIIPLIFNRKSSFVQYHARQGVALLFVWIILAEFFHAPLFPWFFIIYLVDAIVLGIINVVRGRERPVPLIGKWALAK